MERGAAMSKRVGARSGDVKKGRSAERFLPPDGPQDYVASGFAILDACDAIIHNSNIPARKAGEFILSKFLSVDEYGFTCTGHEAGICSKAIRIVANSFFNNKRKSSTEQVADDRVASFKKVKRSKRSSV